MKKKILLLFALFTLISFYTQASIEEDMSKEQMKQIEQELENERRNQELLRKQEELDKQKFEGKNPIIIESVQDTVEFPIWKIEIIDHENVLSQKSKKAFIKKYSYTMMGINKVNQAVEYLTKLYLDEGYVTTRVQIPDDETLSDRTLTLEVKHGYIEDIVLNYNNPMDKAKIFLSIPTTKGKILQLKDIEQGTDQFNRVMSNRAEIEIEPGEADQTSILRITNKPEKSYEIKLSYNNTGSESTGKDRGKLDITKDNLLGINDSLRLSYQRGRNDRQKREMKTVGGVIIAPGPEEKENRMIEDWNIGYSFPIKNWTIDAGYNHSFFMSSTKSHNGIYDSKGITRQSTLSIDRLLHRNKTEKTNMSFNLKVKQNINYFESALLNDRTSTHATLSLSHSRSFIGGLLNVTGEVSKGVAWFGAEKDKKTTSKEPKNEYLLYGMNINCSERFDLSFNRSSTIHRRYVK